MSIFYPSTLISPSKNCSVLGSRMLMPSRKNPRFQARKKHEDGYITNRRIEFIDEFKSARTSFSMDGQALIHKLRKSIFNSADPLPFCHPPPT
uniref:Ovule protein n=1 Tax=Panagrellus redivivus TaxID=6233 RepID=A0A7E4ZRC5_PANRE